MPKLKQKYKNPLREINQAPNVLQTNRVCLHPSSIESKPTEATSEILERVGPLLEDENCQPGTLTTTIGTSELYNELNSFRDKWKRELGLQNQNTKSDEIEEKLTNREATIGDQTYAEAKRLFLIAVELEKSYKQYESIRYYKRSMRLCPDIEKQIFKEQCEASIQAATTANQAIPKTEPDKLSVDGQQIPYIDLYERIFESYHNDGENQNYSYCRPQHRVKPGVLHISDLPHELLTNIFRYVVGSELDLASLEQAGLVCRGFYLISREKSLWRDICFNTWGSNTLGSTLKRSSDIDWRQMFLERPRVNFDGVYISRARYFRQGDVGFQDITHRPFHVVRYYRYLRFFPDSRVLMLTTSEDPDKIVPIFRHALSAKQFSSELSIMEGTYEFSPDNQLRIKAEKKCRQLQPSQNYSRRQAQKIVWSRQTPIAQSFNIKYDLKTVESRPYKNNLLSWSEYIIVTKLETGQEVTNFDLSPETFPNLVFSRVKRFNLRSAKPLSSH